MRPASMRTALAAAMLFLAACAKPPVRDQLTLEFVRDADVVVVTAEIVLDPGGSTPAARARVDALRAAIQSSNDPWAVRFGRLQPEADRYAVDRRAGEIESVMRSARIAPADLQLLLSDTGITVSIMRGNGWRELALYAGSSGRATREQEQRFQAELEAWSRSVVRYFQAVDHLYDYLRVEPRRAEVLFAALLGERGSDGLVPPVTEEEEALVDAVVEAMEVIGERIERQEEDAISFAEQADLIHNPLPSRITVRLPGDVLSSEGFAVEADGTVTAEPVDLFEVIASLEGRWIDPDPLAAILRDERVSAAQLAAMPRSSTSVIGGGEVADAIRELLVQPRTRVVRWRD